MKNQKKTAAIILSALFLFFSQFAFSQYWEKNYYPDSAYGYMGRTAIETPDGGIIFSSTLDFNSGNTVKTDVAGNVQWTKNYFGNSIVAAKDSNYVLAGRVNNMMDIGVYKIDISGNILWQHVYNFSYQDGVAYIDTTSDGGFIIAGETELSVDMDMALIKLDSAGNLSWIRTFGDSLSDNASEAHQTKDGGYILAGRLEDVLYSPIAIIIKTDSAGVQQWSATYPSSSAGFSIKQTHDGGYVVSGGREIYKIDSLGITIWNNYIGDSVIYEILELPDGNFVGAGYDQFAFFDRKYLWLKLDAAGNVLQSKNYQILPGDKFIESIKLTSDGGFLMAGSWTPSGSSAAHIIKTDSLGNPYSNNLYGKILIDANQNCINDSGDYPVTNINVTAVSANQQFNAVSDVSGNFFIGALPGNYTISAQIPPIYSLSCPASGSYQVNLTTPYQYDSLLNFFLISNGFVRDLAVDITSSVFSYSALAQYWITVSNNGNAAESGYVFLTYDTLLSYFNSSEPYDSLQNNSIFFSYQNLAPYQTRTFYVELEISLNSPLGYVFNASSCVYPLSGDVNPNNNCTTDNNRHLQALAAHEYKESYSPGADSSGNISVNDTMTYTIGFQNTGNDTAFVIEIRDLLDPNLDINTFTYIASSHPCSISFLNNNVLRVLFSTIQLPDSNTNEPLSHGFFKFSIKPKSTTAAGSVILNTATIYFNFNSPVSTNTTINYIASPTSVQNFFNSNVGIFIVPNPANTFVTLFIKSLINQSIEIRIYNPLGTQVYFSKEETVAGNFSKEINAEYLPNGIYFLQVKMKDGVFNKKMVVEH